MKRDNIQDIFGLDGAQTAQLVHTLTPDRDDPGLIQVLFRAKGPMDHAVMQAAWNDAIARHEALRLTVQMPAGKKPMLVLGKTAALEIAHHDLSNEPAEPQEKALAALLEEDRQEKLTLSDCPAMRLVSVRLSPQEHQFIWTCHHIFLDGWSAAVILRDVLTFHQARLSGHAPDLPDVPRLRDYYAQLKTRQTQESQAFWRDYLDRCPVVPHMARLARPGSTDATSPATGVIPLSMDLAEAASRTKSTPATLIGLAWAVLLAACSDRRDVVFCKTVSGRNLDLDGMDRMAGSFARAVPVRCHLDPDETVATSLKRLQKRDFTAQSHEYLLLDEIIEATGHGASMAGFDTLLVVQNHPWQESTGGSDGQLVMCDFTSDIMSAFPLTLIATPGVAQKLEYIAAADLDADKVRALLGQLPDILRHLCADPAGTRLKDVLAVIEVPGGSCPDKDAARLGIIDDMLNGRTRKPRTPVELEIARIWQGVLGLTDIDIDQDFVSQGGRSFAAMRILTQIESRFGLRIPLIDFVKSPTISALARLVEGKTEVSEVPWKTFVPIQPNGTKSPLVFLHVSGSHVVFLQPLAKRLGADQPIYAFQPVGLEGEAMPIRSFAELAKLYVAELLQVQPEGPYNIVGHCAGGRLALEVAHLLQEKGHDIATIVVIDTPEPRPVVSPTERFKQLFAQRQFDQIFLAGLRKLRPKPLREGWVERTARVDERKRKIVDDVERACFAADVRYQGRKHPGTIKLLRSEERAWKSFAWDRFAARVDEVFLPMRHFEMFFEPDVGVLAEALAAHLDVVHGARSEGHEFPPSDHAETGHTLSEGR